MSVPRCRGRGALAGAGVDGHENAAIVDAVFVISGIVFADAMIAWSTLANPPAPIRATRYAAPVIAAPGIADEAIAPAATNGLMPGIASAAIPSSVPIPAPCLRLSRQSRSFLRPHCRRSWYFFAVLLERRSRWRESLTPASAQVADGRAPFFGTAGRKRQISMFLVHYAKYSPTRPKEARGAGSVSIQPAPGVVSASAGSEPSCSRSQSANARFACRS